MSKLDDVTVFTRANVYFDGKCVSHTVISRDGIRRTLGVIMPSSLKFDTSVPEVMEIVEGRCRVKIAGQGDAKEYATGQSFAVEGNTSFEIETLETLHYICHFGK